MTTNNPWPELLPKFLKDVWPRQKSVKSGDASAHLCEIAFSNEERFEEISDIVIDLVGPVEGDRFRLPDLRNENIEIISKHPEKSLALLYAVLSEDVSNWPYDFGDVLAKFNACDEKIRNDPKLIELNRRWNSR
jgi:hypothetical protein